MTTIIVMVALIIIAAIAWVAIANRSPDHSQYDEPEPPLLASPGDISGAHHTVVSRLKEYHSAPVTRDIKTGRRRFAELFGDDPGPGVTVTTVDIDGIKAEWLVADKATPGLRLLYLHGGAFMVGSPLTHRFITGSLARESGAAVLAIDYRKMPEHKVIDCHEDARTAYRWILANGPDGPGEPDHLFVAGDSAGGNLTLAVIAWARDNGLRAADGAIGFAPSTDASLSSPTWRDNLATDHFLGPGFGRILKIPKLVRAALSKTQYGRRVNDPEISPLFGDLSNLPPILIQVSAHEMLYGDAVRYANKAASQGTEVTVQAWPQLVHVFQLFSDLPEAQDALARAASFIRDNAGKATQAA